VHTSARREIREEEIRRRRTRGKEVFTGGKEIKKNQN
jgi:hypothetical protein